MNQTKAKASILNRPAVIGLAAGLYPLFFYYTHNFALINSWNHLGFFIVLFLVVPVVAELLAERYLRNKSSERRNSVYLFINLFFFFNFIGLCLFAGLQWWILLSALALAYLLARWSVAKIKTVAGTQYILALIGLFSLVPTVMGQLSYNKTWTRLPDNIEQAKFAHTPNVYYIQPDGLVNFSELYKGHYSYPNHQFEASIKQLGFTNYPDVRSNYNSTVVSNAATFSMRHHYYNYGFDFSEIINGRELIVGDNPVLRIFKNNGYKTHFITEHPYLLTNKPKVGFDYCNFDVSELKLMGDGFVEEAIQLQPLLEQQLAVLDQQPGFFFIQTFKPGHIEVKKAKAKSVEEEKQIYFDRLEEAQAMVQNLCASIVAKDPTALIIIMADHGGYLGWEYMLALRERNMDRDLLYSAFSTQLSIRWPENLQPKYHQKIGSGVNLFRTLFAEMADRPEYLDWLEDNGSYSIIKKGGPKGIYQLINDKGEIVFERVSTKNSH